MTPNERTHAERPSDEVVSAWRKTKIPRNGAAAWEDLGELQRQTWRDDYARQLDAAKSAQGADISLLDRAAAWDAIVDVLDEVSPNWTDRDDTTGIEGACRVIRELSAQAPQRRMVTDEDVERAAKAAYPLHWKFLGKYRLDTIRTILESLAGVPAAQDADVAAAVERLKDRVFPDHECPAESAAVWNTALYEMQIALAGEVPILSTAPGAASEADARDATSLFLADVETELRRARTKFPGDRIMTIALAEEFGELAKAVLDEPSSNVRKEAIQTAVMAARVCIDGDSSVNEWRASKGLDELTDAALAAQQRKGG